MSGIAGIVNFDGGGIQRQLMQRMVDGLVFRGPDAHGVWSDGDVCLIHTSLSVTDDPQEQQPFTIDGDVWIVADARVDGRQDLARELTSRTGQRLSEASDVELLLRSYLEWGTACVDYLVGDFAFAIWDGRSRELFCARDHFGVKPFYYAYQKGAFVFSNTLRCVLEHPAVTDGLNEMAIADFLLFGYNKELGTTTFADVKRLRPAHTLVVREGQLRERVYWQLPIEEPLRYRRGEAYVEQFRDLFDQAVADRLRASQVGVLMSGGLDSTSVAATAHDLLSRSGESFDFRIYTGGYEELISDHERQYSEMLARRFNAPIHFTAADDFMLYQGWELGAAVSPQPYDNPLPIVTDRMFAAAVQHSRVILTGMGGDPTLYPSQRFPLALFPRGHLAPSLVQVGQFVRRRRRLPPFYLRTTLQRWLGRYPPARAFPPWLNEEFVRRLDLRQRWQALEEKARATEHPRRPEAYRLLKKSTWAHVFENYYDAAVTSYAVEVRHPYFDVRLVRFLLRVPPLPWFIRKEIVRLAMRHRLPDAIRLRPKEIMSGNPLWPALEEKEKGWMEEVLATHFLHNYVDVEKYMSVYDARRELGTFQSPLLTRPLSLAYWLHNLAPEAFV